MNTLKKYNIRRFFSAFLCLLVVGNSHVLAGPFWQDDPFDPFATDETDVQTPIDQGADSDPDVTLDESLSDGVRLIIQSLRESNPTKPMELARAIKTMITVEQYGEASKYLQQLIATNMDRQQMFELADQMGPAFLLDLRQIDQLQPQGQAFADLVFKSANEEAYAPERINELITELSDDNKFVRQAAFQRLQQLGGPAVSTMLEVCEDQNRRKEVPFVSSALKQMGSPALFPLIAAARADGTVAQAVAAGALSNINSPLAVDALLRMSISSRISHNVRAIAAEAIARRGFVSDAQIRKRIFDRANDYLEGRVTIPSNSQGQSKIWTWNFASGKMIATETSMENAVRIMSVDLARDIFSLEPQNSEYRKLQLLSVLEATKRVLGPNRNVLMSEVTTFISDLNPQDIDVALTNALDRKLIPAAVGAAELAGQTKDPDILIPTNGNFSTLVNAILSGHRQLQFAAAKAISELDPQQPFPGCSYVSQFIAMLANTSGNSSAVAVHPRPDQAQTLATAIFQSGRIGLTANSSKELFDMLRTNPDIDFLIIADRMTQPHYHDLVQQIRGFWISQNMPIALVVRTEDQERRSKLVLGSDPSTMILPFSYDAKSVYGQVKRLLDILPASNVSNVQRELQSQFAMNWMAKTLADPTNYGFYELNRFRDQISELVRLPGSFDVKAKILTHLGTQRAQRILVDLASDAAMGLTERQIMVDAFNQSLDHNGILLSRTDIKTQYDRYQASLSQSPDAREILGAILDSLEAKAVGERVSRSSN